MPETLQQQIDAALMEGFVIVQEGEVLMPVRRAVLTQPRPTTEVRLRGFNMSMLGTFAPPTWRSQFDNRIFEDDERWVHLRRPREAT